MVVKPERSLTWAQICHGAIALMVFVAIVAQLVLLATGGSDANTGRDTSHLSYLARVGQFFSYFTVQSNVLVMIASATLALRPQPDGRIWRVLRLDALMGIVITGLVFDFVLAQQVHLSGLSLVITIAFHYISPWATLLLWLFLGPRPRIDWHTVAWAFAWPVAWIAFTFVHGAVSGFWPYPFLDADTKGYPTALLNTGIVVLIAVALALGFKAGDRMGTLGNSRSSRPS